MSIPLLSKHHILKDSRNSQASPAAWWDASWAPSLLSEKQQNILKVLPLKKESLYSDDKQNVNYLQSYLKPVKTRNSHTIYVSLGESTQLLFIWSSPFSFSTATETTVLCEIPAGKEPHKNKK